MHLVFVFGPPAVGKMTVGREICARTGYKLLHNHMTVEPVLDVFPFGSPPFNRLVSEFRGRILEEAVLALDGLVFTMVWGLELEEDLTDRLDTRKAIDRAKGVLQKELSLTEPDAFRWIQKTAMDLRLSMRQVADGVVEHGIPASPDTPPE